MKIRNLFPLLLVAVAAVASLPDQMSAQVVWISDCYVCGTCAWPSGRPDAGAMCMGRIPAFGIGWKQCSQGEEICTCRTSQIGWCSGPCLPCGDPDEQTAELTESLVSETLAAIKAGESIPADGPYFYARRGAEFVVRRKCDAAEVVRVAVAKVASTPILGLD